MNNVIDLKREFVYVKFNDLVLERVQELIDDDANNTWAEYHKQLLDYMRYNFSRAFLVVEYNPIGFEEQWKERAEIAAEQQFYNYLLATSDKYVKLIEFQEYKLNELLELRKEIDKAGSSGALRTNLEYPTEDSTLRKFNETPLSGNNPDLLDDTYLSESERNTITAGQRESESTDDESYTSFDITRDDVERLSAIPLIRENIRNYYLEWIGDIDRELFTYIPLDF